MNETAVRRICRCHVVSSGQLEVERRVARRRPSPSRRSRGSARPRTRPLRGSPGLWAAARGSPARWDGSCAGRAGARRPRCRSGSAAPALRHVRRAANAAAASREPERLDERRVERRHRHGGVGRGRVAGASCSVRSATSSRERALRERRVGLERRLRRRPSGRATVTSLIWGCAQEVFAAPAAMAGRASARQSSGRRTWRRISQPIGALADERFRLQG